MPATALAPHRLVEQASFRAEIVKYVAYACRQGRVKRADFEDLVQQIWSVVIARIATFQPEKGTFENWVRGIALNVIRRHARDKERYAKRFCEHPSNMVEHAAPEPSPERCLQRKQAICAISKAVEGLSEQQAQVLLLHVDDDMSHGQIAEKLGITESASQKCFQRTRDKLAQCLGDELRCVMPPFATGCDEPASSQAVPRWHEWSHYSGQITAAVLAFLLFIPSSPAPRLHASAIGEIQTMVPSQINSMCQQDKRLGVHDEPVVLREAPIGKPEPASLPSVRAVPVRTGVADKPVPFKYSVPPSPYKHLARTSENRPPG